MGGPLGVGVGVGAPMVWARRVEKGGAPRRTQTQKKWGFEGQRVGARRVGGPKFSAFCPSPALILVLFLSLGVFSWNFSGV